MNGMLASVKELIRVQPIVFRTDIENSPTGGQFLTDNAKFFVEENELLGIENGDVDENSTIKETILSS